jgi:hypothetical protein
MYFGPTMVRRDGKVVNLLDLKERHHRLALQKQLDLEQQLLREAGEEEMEQEEKLAQQKAANKASKASASLFTDTSTAFGDSKIPSAHEANQQDAQLRVFGNKTGVEGGEDTTQAPPSADDYIAPEQVLLPEHYRCAPAAG